MERASFTAIIDFLPDATFAIDRNGYVIAWNRAMETMTGVRKEDMLGKGDYAYSIPFYGKRRPILIDLVKYEGKASQVSYNCMHKEGNYIYAETYVSVLNDGMGAYLWGTAAPLLDDNGDYQGAIESIRDITEHRRAEETLRRERDFSSGILETSAAFFVAIDGDGTVKLMNNSLLKALGYTFEEVVGKDYISTFVPVIDREQLTVVFSRLTDHNQSTIHVNRILTKNESELLVEWRGRTITKPDGSIDYFIGMGIDITERNKADEELKFRNLILTTQQEVSADGILVIDKEGGILSCNRLFIDMWGIPEEVIEKRSDELAPQLVLDKLSDPEEFVARVKYLYEHIKETSSDEIALKDGRIFDRYSSPMIGADEKYYGRVWFFRDITDRKIAKKLLKEQLQRFLILADEAPFGIALINEDGKYTYLNTKFRDIFGYDLHDIPDGRTWFRKAYPDAGYRHKVIQIWFNDVERIEEKISLADEGKWTFTVTCKDATEKIISFIMLRLLTGEYLMTCEDITERRKTEEALEKREAELEIKSTNLEEMNSALKVLLKERENDKVELEEKILSNVRELVLPYIEKLKRSRLDSQYMTYVDIIETNLNDIVSPFLQKMGLKYAHLTPTEIEIANLIKNGKRTKEIGDLLHMSPGAINFHRNNIRKKLGLNNEKVNLRSYLMSLQ